MCGQVEWLREKSRDIPIRLVFESALELMGTTQLGGFKVCLHSDVGPVDAGMAYPKCAGRDALPCTAAWRECLH